MRRPYRVVVTRPAGESSELLAALEAAGFEVHSRPLITFREIPAALDSHALDRAHWIVFASPRAVTSFDALLRPEQEVVKQRVAVACVGPQTAKRAREVGYAVQLVPEEHSARGVLEAFDHHGGVRGQHVLLPRAREGRTELAEGLEQRGATVGAIAVYETLPAEGLEDDFAVLASAGIDCIALASPSTAKALAAILGSKRIGGVAGLGCAYACIGRVTAAAATKLGLRPVFTAAQATTDAFVETIAEACRLKNE